MVVPLNATRSLSGPPIAYDADLERIEIELLLEGVYRHYGFDFRSYAYRLDPAAAMETHRSRRADVDLRTPGPRAARRRRDGAPAARLCRSASRRCSAIPASIACFANRWCRCCAPIRSFASGTRAVRPAKRSTRRRSCSRRRGCSTGRASTRRTSTTPCSQHARAGIFPLNRMQEYTENYIRAGGTRSFSEYYTAKYDGALFSPSLTRNIVFSQHNLVTDHSFSEFNVIFCRNVLIYFDRDLQDRVHALFYDSLARFGILALGSKESLRFSRYESCYDRLGVERKALPEGPVAMSYDIAVVGTSWGGLSALRELIAELPHQFALPLVIVQHRHRESDRLLGSLLQDSTSLSVCEVEDKSPIVSGGVYIAPADYHLLVEDGHFSLSTEAPVNYSRPSIDVTFSSIADAYGERAVGVVLTGANADGAHGLRRIVDRGGLAFVQTPDTAESSTMPAAAASAVPEARVLTIGEIGAALAVTSGRDMSDARARRCGRHSPRRRPRREPARARGDSRTARPAPVARAIGRRGAALAARAATSPSSCSTSRCRGSTVSRRRSSSSRENTRGTCRSSSSRRSAKRRSTSSRDTRSARSTTCSNRFSPEILRSKVQVFIDLYVQQRRIAEQEQRLRDTDRQDLELRHMRELLESEAQFREIVEFGDGRDHSRSTPAARSRSSTGPPSGCSARPRRMRPGRRSNTSSSTTLARRRWTRSVPRRTGSRARASRGARPIGRSPGGAWMASRFRSKRRCRCLDSPAVARTR